MRNQEQQRVTHTIKGLHYAPSILQAFIRSEFPAPAMSNRKVLSPLKISAEPEINVTALQTLKLAVIDAIEAAEIRGDLNLALIYAGLLKKDLDPLLRRRFNI